VGDRNDPPSHKILEDFVGEVCSGCGGKKKPRMSHCRNCYFALPEGMRRALYRRFGSGYEAAFRESTEWLRARKKPAEDDAEHNH
jgi:hypothetical protein